MNVLKIFSNIDTFFKEVKAEVKKVNWPTARETIRYTAITIAVSSLVAFYLGGLDLIFSKLLSRFIF